MPRDSAKSLADALHSWIQRNKTFFVSNTVVEKEKKRRPWLWPNPDSTFLQLALIKLLYESESDEKQSWKNVEFDQVNAQIFV